MYVYLDNKKLYGVCTVGFYDPAGKWHPESDHATSEEAAARVHYLNGAKDEPELSDREPASIPHKQLEG